MADGNRAVGRWLGASRAAQRDLERRGVLVRGYVVVGVSLEHQVLRAMVEYPSTIDIKPDYARVWRGDLEMARSLAEAAAERLSTNAMAGQGLVYQVYDIDDPTCPIQLDWVDYDHQMRKVRVTQREDYFRRHNIGFRQRLTWATLASG